MNPLPSVFPPAHRAFLAGALPVLAADARVVGLAVGGSCVQGGMDVYSDLDLIVVVTDAAREVLADAGSESFPPIAPAPPPEGTLPHDARIRLAASLGPMLSAFTAEHTGERRMIIALYDTADEASRASAAPAPQAASPLHVDLKFVSLAEFRHRVEDPFLLLDPDGHLARAIHDHPAAPPPDPDPAWIEGRWWTWVHYALEKAMRGELGEALAALDFLRGRVLGPMALRAAGQSGITAQGLRRLESRAPEWSAAMRDTVATYDRAACVLAVRACAELYRKLREALALPVEGGSRAEAAVMAYVSRCAEEVLARGGLTPPGGG